MREDDELPTPAAPPAPLGPFEAELVRNGGAHAIDLSVQELEAATSHPDASTDAERQDGSDPASQEKELPDREQAAGDGGEEGQNGAESEGAEHAAMRHDAAGSTHVRVRARRTRFLAALRQSGNIRLSAREAGIDRETVRRWRLSDPWFARKEKEALEDFADLADMTAKHLALEGARVPIVHQGVIVDYKLERSEKLLLRINERLNPETWGAASAARKEAAGPAQRAEHVIPGSLTTKEIADRVRDFLPKLARMEAERMILEGRVPKVIQGRTIEPQP